MPNRRTPEELKVTKQKILGYLTKGRKWTEACDLAGVPVSTAGRWKRLDDYFRHEVQKLLSSAVYREQELEKYVRNRIVLKPNWRTRFILKYQPNGNRNEAANIAGKSATEIEDLLNPASEQYDETFAGMVNEVNTRRVWDIEDGAIREAEKGSQAMQRFLLERLKPETYGRSPKQLGGDKTLNVFWFTGQDEKKTIESLSGIFEGEVIDVES